MQKNLVLKNVYHTILIFYNSYIIQFLLYLLYYILFYIMLSILLSHAHIYKKKKQVMKICTQVTKNAEELQIKHGQIKTATQDIT